jgi:hypothetical protein
LALFSVNNKTSKRIKRQSYVITTEIETENLYNYFMEEEIDCEEIVYGRAAGELVCSECGKDHRDHPWLEKCLGFDDHPYLRELCDGTLVKL